GCHATAQHSRAISADLHEEFLVLPEGKGEAGPIHYQPVLDYVVILYSNKAGEGAVSIAPHTYCLICAALVPGCSWSCGSVRMIS
ncbi:hypothetical protein E2320_009173, partial [Naja naja]